MFMGLKVFSYALQDEPGLVKSLFDKVGELVLKEFYDALDRESVGAI